MSGRIVQKLSVTALALALALPAVVSHATAQADATDEATRTIIARLQALRPDLPIRGVTPAPVDGIYAVELAGGGVLYATADGRYLFAGDLFELGASELVNLTERGREVRRRDLIGSIDVEELLVFAPDGETRAVINVFTDIDCGYCRQLHRDMARLNALGIEVRYFGYPRAGLGSSSYDKLVTAWCAENPQEALTRLKLGEELPSRTCPNPIAAHYGLGDQVGVTGTPSIITSEGFMIPGYLPPEDLAARIGLGR
jgi:thiol:disulfide interchange protein DsbC